MFAGISQHVFQVVTLRHNGQGLPTKIGAPIFILMAITLLTAIIRNLVSPELTWLIFVIAETILGGIIIDLARRGRPKFASVILCACIGTDTTSILFSLAGLKLPSVILMIWAVVILLKVHPEET